VTLRCFQILKLRGYTGWALVRGVSITATGMASQKIQFGQVVLVGVGKFGNASSAICIAFGRPFWPSSST
jgi:hypothetical protein